MKKEFLIAYKEDVLEKKLEQLKTLPFVESNDKNYERIILDKTVVVKIEYIGNESYDEAYNILKENDIEAEKIHERNINNNYQK